MTVLIEGMEMPNNCYQCKFAVARYDTLPTQNYRRQDFVCVLIDKALTSTKRNRACLLSEVPTWVSVKDRLPEPWTEVLIYRGVDWPVVSDVVDTNGRWRFSNVTHWMPLPALPKEG